MNEKDNNTLLICSCCSVEHQIIFNEFTHNGYTTVYMTTHLKPEPSIFKRLCNAVKYLFGHRSMYGDFDEFIFRQKDWEKLQKLTDAVKGSEGNK